VDAWADMATSVVSTSAMRPGGDRDRGQSLSRSLVAESGDYTGCFWTAFLLNQWISYRFLNCHRRQWNTMDSPLTAATPIRNLVAGANHNNGLGHWAEIGLLLVSEAAPKSTGQGVPLG